MDFKPVKLCLQIDLLLHFGHTEGLDVCMCVYIYIYIYTHTHTHTLMHTQIQKIVPTVIVVHDINAFTYEEMKDSNSHFIILFYINILDYEKNSGFLSIISCWGYVCDKVQKII